METPKTKLGEKSQRETSLVLLDSPFAAISLKKSSFFGIVAVNTQPDQTISERVTVCVGVSKPINQTISERVTVFGW